MLLVYVWRRRLIPETRVRSPVATHLWTSQDPASSCLLSGPGLQLDSRYTGSRGWFGGSSGMPSAGEEDSVTGTLKHVKSSVVRSGGIVLRWSSCYSIWRRRLIPETRVRSPVATYLLTSLNLPVSYVAPESNWIPVYTISADQSKCPFCRNPYEGIQTPLWYRCKSRSIIEGEQKGRLLQALEFTISQYYKRRTERMRERESLERERA